MNGALRYARARDADGAYPVKRDDGVVVGWIRAHYIEGSRVPVAAYWTFLFAASARPSEGAAEAEWQKHATRGDALEAMRRALDLPA